MKKSCFEDCQDIFKIGQFDQASQNLLKNGYLESLFQHIKKFYAIHPKIGLETDTGYQGNYSYFFEF